MSSKRRLRRKACKGKVRHATIDAGQAAIAALNRQRGWQGRMNAYHCRWCGGVHIGHAGGR